MSRQLKLTEIDDSLLTHLFPLASANGSWLSFQTGTESLETTTMRFQTSTESLETTTMRFETSTESLETSTMRFQTSTESLETTTMRFETGTKSLETSTMRFQTGTESPETTTMRFQTSTESFETRSLSLQTGTLWAETRRFLFANIILNICLMKTRLLQLFLSFCFYSAPSTADVLKVPVQFSTIQKAIDTAVQHDTILVSDGIYSGLGNFNINMNGKNLVIKSENGPLKTSLKLNNNRGFIFLNNEDSTCVIDGFTIYGGDAGMEPINTVPLHSTGGGAIYIFNASPVIKNCIIEKNTGYYGCGVKITGSQNTKFINCVFRDNRNFWGAGGGLFLADDFTVFENCLITGNETGWGSAIFLGGSHSVFKNCTIVNNSSLAETSGRNITAWYKNNPSYIRCIIYGGGTNQISISPFEEESKLNCKIIQSIIEGGYGGKENYDITPEFTNKNSYVLKDDVYGKLGIDYKIGADIPYLSHEIQEEEKDFTFYYLIVSHLLFGSVVFFVTKYRGRFLIRKKTEIQQHSKPETDVVKNSVFLFGSFAVLDKGGINVANQFPDIAKELFLRLLIKNNNHDLTADEISSYIWGNEIGLNKNPLQVALSKLRKLLRDSGLPISIKKEGSSYSLEFGSELYCDYLHYKSLTSSNESIPNESDISIWIEITSKGEFLKGISYPWLDDKKAEIETKIISQSKRYLEVATDEQKKKLLRIVKMYET